MKKILILALAASLSGCGAPQNAVPAVGADKSWQAVGDGVYMKTVEVEGHRYLVTIRNGSYSYNASAIHAASCPCNSVSR